MQFLDDAKMGHLAGVIAFVEEYGAIGLEVRDRDWSPRNEPVWKTDEKTALMHAVWEQHRDVAEYLIAQGANVNARDKRGTSSLMLSHDPVMAGMLLDAGAKIDQKDLDGRTALMRPSTPEKIRLLISRGANLEARDEQGQTALMTAARGNRASGYATVAGSLNALLDGGADPNARDNKGWTALMHAASHAIYYPDSEDEFLIDHVRLLIARGADPELCDNAGNTAQSIAWPRRPGLDGNIEQQQEVAARLASEIAARKEKMLALFIEGAAQDIPVMKPLQFRK